MHKCLLIEICVMFFFSFRLWDEIILEAQVMWRPSPLHLCAPQDILFIVHIDGVVLVFSLFNWVGTGRDGSHFTELKNKASTRVNHFPVGHPNLVSRSRSTVMGQEQPTYRGRERLIDMDNNQSLSALFLCDV